MRATVRWRPPVGGGPAGVPHSEESPFRGTRLRYTPAPLADAVALSSFPDLVPDPRGIRGRRYRLSALVAVTAASVRAVARSLTASTGPASESAVLLRDPAYAPARYRPALHHPRPLTGAARLPRHHPEELPRRRCRAQRPSPDPHLIRPLFPSRRRIRLSGRGRPSREAHGVDERISEQCDRPFVRAQ